MKYVQENFARDLHKDLFRHFASAAPATELTINGTGVNWWCTIKHGGRACEINCFDASFKGITAEYLSAFNENGQTIVWGRTLSKQEIIAAAHSWLEGHTLADLEEQFNFIDSNKRNLLTIAKAIVAHSPKIQQDSVQEVKRLSCDLCELWLTQRDRSCKLSYYGKNEFADATFHWDGCALFHFQADDMTKLAEVVKRWLCDHAMPSVLRSDFPWLDVGELADYYEIGKPIEGEFVMSWNSIERFYVNMSFGPKVQILKLVAAMRLRGYDKTLRAGQSMYSLILSRSRRHGLDQHQSCLQFSFKEKNMEIHARFENTENLPIPQIALTPQVESLLERLASQTID